MKRDPKFPSFVGKGDYRGCSWGQLTVIRLATFVNAGVQGKTGQLKNIEEVLGGDMVLESGGLLGM